MKKIFLLFSVILFFSFSTQEDSLTEKERKYATDLLQSSQQKLLETVNGLSDEQLKFKPAADKWSVEDCLKHIAFTETGLWHVTDSVINSTANPEKRSEIKSTDEQVVQMISDRTNKVKTSPAMEPQNTPYTSASEAIESFQQNRGRLIEYVNKTDKDLRNHVVVFPFGHFDTYQMILFIGAHSQRHTKQIEEVMATEGFPGK